ncbi:MAG TPA: cellulase family glycosylhydrolase [Bacteroidales bacterium]|nr:cellulase family glycosylhydrolase [Bacteroidales bacterium]
MAKKNSSISTRKKILNFILLFIFIQNLSAQSFLRVRGTNIVDESGKSILLRGVGLGNWLLPEGYMWKFGANGDRPRKIEQLVEDCIGAEKANAFWHDFRTYYITEVDVKKIAELGFNSVRPALNSRLFITEGENNAWVDEGFQRLDSLIKWCKKYKIYVVIDMHGAPGGQTGQNIDDSPNNQPELFMDPKNEALLEKLWIRIVEKYKDEPIVAAYDLLNEPLPENTGAAEKYKDRLLPVYQRLIKSIRAIDKKHMITVEGYNWANNWSLFDKPLDSNIFYQFHYYCWDRPDNLNDISYFLNKQKQLNTPVWVGETGEKNNTIYFATAQYFEKNNIGWSFWPWKKMETQNTPYSIKAPEGWDAIVAFSKGESKPETTAKTEKIFQDLINNIKIENCIYFPDVVNAVFRQIPLNVEAENYGHDGYNNSYFVKDSSARSNTYRKNEPVNIKIFENETSGQAIELTAGEWTAYKVFAKTASTYNIVLKAKAIQLPAEATILVNKKSFKVKADPADWIEINVGNANFLPGENKIKVLVYKGTLQLDWMDIK